MENQNPIQPIAQPQLVVSHPQSSGPSKVFLILIVLILLVAVGAGAYFLGMKNTQPIPQPVVATPVVVKPTPTIAPTASWKTYTDAKFGFSFKYPLDWTFNTASEQNQTSVDPKTEKPYFTDTHTVFFSINSADPKKVTLAMQVMIHSNINNWDLSQWINEETYGNGISYLGTTRQLMIGGQPAVEGVRLPSTKNVYTVSKPDSQGKSELYVFTLYGNGGAVNGGAAGETINPTQALLAQLQPYDSNDPFILKQIQDFETMLTTVTLTNQNQTSTNGTTGTVTGKLCYPASVLPKGQIIAKSLTSGKTFSQDYPGSASGGGSAYSMQLNPDTYHLEYEVAPTTIGYYTNYSSCIDSLQANSASCSGQQLRPALPVSVTASSTIQNVNLCDFYYPPNTPPQF